MEHKPDTVKKKVLGRGLSALLPARPEGDAEYLLLPVCAIRPGPYQPRRAFPEEELRELVDSIREKGLLQPVLVRPAAEGYELVAGERRLRAAQAAGLSTIPAVVRRLSDRESLEAAVVENLQRADLNPMELAQGLARLAHEFDMTHDEIAKRLGKDRATVSNTVRLLRLPQAVREAVADGRLSAGHARALLSAPPGRLEAIAARVMAAGLSVRQTEELCRDGGQRRAARRARRPDPHVRDLEEKLSRRAGTRVRIRGTARKGRIEIHFFSEKEFERLCEGLFPGR